MPRPKSWGVKVTRIEIKDIAPPRDLIDSMARQMKAEREKRAQILESEGLRQAAILKAEGEKQAVVLEAEGRREAAFKDAEARERAAEAEAKATTLVSNAIANGNVQAINYFVANNYVKALEALAKAPNQKVILMPLEASSVIGSLAGLAQITGEAFGGDGSASRPRRRAERAPAACRRSSRSERRVLLDYDCVSIPVTLRKRPAMERSLTSSPTSASGTGCSSGSLLMALETVVPGVHFLWFGLSAVIVGVLAFALSAPGSRRALHLALAARRLRRHLRHDRLLGPGHARAKSRPRPTSQTSTCAARSTSAASCRRGCDRGRARQGARRRHALAGAGRGYRQGRARQE